VVWQAANHRRLSVENFDGQNVDCDELIKIHQYFPRQNFVPYGTSTTKICTVANKQTILRSYMHKCL